MTAGTARRRREPVPGAAGGVPDRRCGVRRRVRAADLWPPHLREFREQDWPPQEGECLGHYTCHQLGYGVPCISLDGPCGWKNYEMLARDYPDQPDMLARAKRADAWTRFHQARLAFLGEDHPRWLTEWIEGFGTYEQIRYGRRPGEYLVECRC